VFKKLLNRKKHKCRKFKHFKTYIENEKFDYFDNFDFLIEGHYHQNIQFVIKDKKYLNLPAFTCNNLYVILKLSNNNMEFVTKEYQNET
jgi:UDP-2,3-diacylglucosamine hydrolase